MIIDPFFYRKIKRHIHTLYIYIYVFALVVFRGQNLHKMKKIYIFMCNYIAFILLEAFVHSSVAVEKQVEPLKVTEKN